MRLSVVVACFATAAMLAPLGACSSSGDDQAAASSSNASSASASASTSSSGGGGAGGGTTASTGGAGGASSSTGSGGMGGSAAGITWKAGPQMAYPRQDFTATKLADGRVIAIGGDAGNSVALKSTEIFDPTTNKWSAGPDMNEGRMNHSAVLLEDGTVLVIGGGDHDVNGLPSGQGVLASTEIFDPTTNMFTAGPDLVTGRGFHKSALLADGRVLVFGGVAQGGMSVLATETLSTDHQTWSATGALTHGRSLFGDALDGSGDPIVMGGLDGDTVLSSTEKFDPTTDTWSAEPMMKTGRIYLAAAPLASGGVIAAAGIGAGGNDFLSTTEILAKGAAAWTAGPTFTSNSSSIAGGSGVMLLALDDGEVLATGGYGQELNAYGPGSFSGILDEKANTWTRLSELDTPRGIGVPIELDDHRVILIGGIGPQNTSTNTCSISSAPVD